VPRVLAGNEELDADACVGVAEVFTACERRQPAASFQLFVDALESLARHEDINVFREALEPVREQGHTPDDGIGDAEPVEPPDDALQGTMYGSAAFEKHARLLQTALEALAQAFFVGDHGAPLPVPTEVSAFPPILPDHRPAASRRCA